MASPSSRDDSADSDEVTGHDDDGDGDRASSDLAAGDGDHPDGLAADDHADSTLAESGALALATVGGLVVAAFILASLQPLAYPLCQPLIAVVRDWPTVLAQYVPLLVGAVVLLGGTELSARAGSRRRRPLAAVAAGLGVAVLGRLAVAVGVCGPTALSGLGSRGMDVAVLVAVGAVLAAAGWYRLATA